MRKIATILLPLQLCMPTLYVLGAVQSQEKSFGVSSSIDQPMLVEAEAPVSQVPMWYPAKPLVVKYKDSLSQLPDMDALMNVNVRLVKISDQLTAPTDESEGENIKLLDLCKDPHILYFDLSALKIIADAIAEQLMDQGINNVYVRVAADEMDAEGRDIRSAGNRVLTIMIYPDRNTPVASSVNQAMTSTVVPRSKKEARSFNSPSQKKTNKRLPISVDYALLYWKAIEQGLGFTNASSDVPTTSDFTERSLVRPDFEWNYGLRLGAGYAPSSSSLIDVNWVHYHGRSHQHQHADVLYGMFPAFSLNEDSLKGDYVTSAEIHWNLTLDIIDALYHKNFDYGKWFSIAPNIGIRSVWIAQHGDVSYKGGTFNAGEDFISLGSHFYGIGPRIGIDPRVHFGSHFSLYGKAAAALFYGWFHVQQEEEFVGIDLAHEARRIDGCRWNIDLTGGIEWARLVNSKRWHLDIDLGIDYLFFNHQNEFEHNRHMSGQGKNLHVWGGHVAATVKF